MQIYNSKCIWFFFVKIMFNVHKIRSYASVVALNCTYTYCLTYITFMLTFPSIYALWQYICRHICLYNTCKHMPQQWQPHATTNENKCDNKCNICHIKCKKLPQTMPHRIDAELCLRKCIKCTSYVGGSRPL
jgi:hypothetical protein